MTPIQKKIEKALFINNNWEISEHIHTATINHLSKECKV